MTYLDDRAIATQLWEAIERPRHGRAISTIGNCLLKFYDCAAKRRICWAMPTLRISSSKTAWRTKGEQRCNFLDDLQPENTKQPSREENAQPWRIRPRPGLRLRCSPGTSAYLAEKQRAALYDFDEEELRPYFPLERVVAGMFEIFSPRSRRSRVARRAWRRRTGIRR